MTSDLVSFDIFTVLRDTPLKTEDLKKNNY